MYTVKCVLIRMRQTCWCALVWKARLFSTLTSLRSVSPRPHYVAAESARFRQLLRRRELQHRR